SLLDHCLTPVPIPPRTHATLPPLATRSSGAFAKAVAEYPVATPQSAKRFLDGEAKAGGCGLRANPGQLCSLVWEFVYDRTRRRYRTAKFRTGLAHHLRRNL